MCLIYARGQSIAAVIDSITKGFLAAMTSTSPCSPMCKITRQEAYSILDVYLPVQSYCLFGNRCRYRYIWYKTMHSGPTSAINSKASKMPTIDTVKLAVMKWKLRLLEPTTAITPDPRSSIPKTCMQCIMVCLENAFLAEETYDSHARSHRCTGSIHLLLCSHSGQDSPDRAVLQLRKTSKLSEA